MMALQRRALEGAGAVGATRPPARRTAVRIGPAGRGRRKVQGQGRGRVGAAAAAARYRPAQQLLLCDARPTLHPSHAQYAVQSGCCVA